MRSASPTERQDVGQETDDPDDEGVPHELDHGRPVGSFPQVGQPSRHLREIRLHPLEEGLR